MSEKADIFISMFFNKLNEDEQKEVISYLKNTENDSALTKIVRQILQEKVFTSRIDAGLKDFNGPIFQPSQARQMTGMYQEDRDTGDGGLSARATADPAASARAAAPTPQEVVAKPFTKLDQ